MNFSEVFKNSLKLAQFSPSGYYIANVTQFKLIIRSSDTLQILHMFSCIDAIQQISWSEDSMFILCVIKKRGVVQVWSIEYPEWTCKIDEGSFGLVSAIWAPDSRHILTTTDFHLRVTLWSLTDKSVAYMKHPKACASNIAFSTGGKYMALAERRQLKDYVSIFQCSNWGFLNHFATDTEDLDGLSWSPDTRALAVWENCLRYKVCLYSISGQHIASYSAYNITEGLGIKTVSWGPLAQFLAVGSYDGKIRLLNHITWGALATLAHPSVVENVGSSGSPVVYREIETSPVSTSSTGIAIGLMLPEAGDDSPSTGCCYEILSGNIVVPCVRPESGTSGSSNAIISPPRQGVSLALFSSDSRYLATRNDAQPCAVWLWDVTRLSCCAVLLHVSPVRGFAWDPHQNRLAICSGRQRLFMWSPEGCLAVQVPNTGSASFAVHTIRWHPSGKSLLLISDIEMSVCFVDEDNKEN